jgi:hypothetical protein
MNKAVQIGFCIVILVGALTFLWMASAKPHEVPTDKKNYDRMVHRAAELAVKMSTGGRIDMEQSCEYEELCHRIGKYRADHDDGK